MSRLSGRRAAPVVFRIIGIILALGCAVGFDGGMQARAQSTDPYGALTNPSWCWYREYYLPQSPTASGTIASAGWHQYIMTTTPINLDSWQGGTLTRTPDGNPIVTMGEERIVGYPCPPSAPPSGYTGGYIGAQFVGNWGGMGYNEYSIATSALTSTGSVRGKRDGFGMVGGYNFRPWNNNFVVGPYGSIDFIDHNLLFIFPNGANLGTTTHWVGTIGMNGGFVVNPFFYGLVGISFLNQDRVINFATSTSSNTTTPGFTLGLGAETQPNGLQVFGRPMSVFFQYQHTWWQDAKLNSPAASPGFNYVFKREDDTVKVGVNVYLSAPTPPPKRALITK